MQTSSENTRYGVVCLIGAPNAGKSTLMNRAVGGKVSIVTPKAQTTRSRVAGMVTRRASQIVFYDVPGVFQSTKRFEGAMIEAAWGAAEDADILVFLFDAHRRPDEETEQVLARFAQIQKPCILVLNKIDMVADKAVLLKLVEWFSGRAYWQQVFMISALKDDGVEALMDFLASHVPEGVWHYPEDALTDMPSRLLAAELTREQCFMKLHEELPYTLMVETEKYHEKPNGDVELHQVITVQNERQKMIVIGKSGAMLKAIGASARREIGKMLDQKVHLYLFVKVREDWKENPESYAHHGLQYRR
jgi:GTP-binding protein Era